MLKSAASGGGGAAAPLTLASGTLAADSSALSITQTWNNAGITFSGALFVNVTNTASNTASKIFDFQLGGVSYLSLKRTDPNGTTASTLYGDGTSAYLQMTTAGGAVLGYGTSGNFQAGAGNIRIRIGATSYVNMSSTKWTYHSAHIAGWTSSGDADQTMDTAMSRNAAGVVEINNGTAGTRRDLFVRNVRCEPTVVASLVAAATAGAGAIAFVTDATATTARSTVAGGGANFVMLMSNGTNWLIVA